MTSQVQFLNVMGELRRNASWSSLWGYCAKQAQQRAENRRRRPETHTPTAAIAESRRLAELDWPPEQVAGRLKLEQGLRFSPVVCRARAKSDPTQATCATASHTDSEAKRRSADASPTKGPSASTPRQATGKAAPSSERAARVPTDRESRMLLAAPSPRRTKISVGGALAVLLARQKQAGTCRTLTLDNGKEFAEHQDVERSIEAPVFFADPCASWQRGSNENTNGLLRQYFPKGVPLDQVSKRELDAVVEAINHRPRKRLGWDSPYEAFVAESQRTGQMEIWYKSDKGVLR